MLDDLRIQLKERYQEAIDIGIGAACRVEFNRTYSKNTNAKYAVYIHKEYGIAVIWDLENRKKWKKPNRNLSMSIPWNELLPEPLQINSFYRKVRGKPIIYEKILAVRVQKLRDVLDNYLLFSAFNELDKGFPSDINLNMSEYHWCPEEFRDRVSTTRWERKAQFRVAVLAAYQKKCAICRCAEEQLLEAAHIIAVSDKGSDDVNNGICLCANHHIMLDRKLIHIDYEKLQLSYVADSVKNMPWYQVFCEQYEGRIERRILNV